MPLSEHQIRQYEHEIKWLQDKIAELRLKQIRKPSAIKQIRQYEHQIREIEIKIALQ